jgi:hypothetical protein
MSNTTPAALQAALKNAKSKTRQRAAGPAAPVELATSSKSSRALASRQNGAKSRGPVTPDGLAVSTRNGSTHSVLAFGCITGDELPEQYVATFNSWRETLNPFSPALVQLVHRVADVVHRQERLARLEQSLIEDELEKTLAASEVSKKIHLAKEALEGLQALATLAENVSTSMTVDKVMPLIPPMRHVLELTDKADVPVMVIGKLASAINGFTLNTILEITAESFQAVASACREAERYVQVRISELEIQREQEREKLAMTVLISDSRMLRLLDRYRTRLAREFGLTLNAYEKTRAMALQASSSGSPGPPCVVELKVIKQAAR